MRLLSCGMLAVGILTSGSAAPPDVTSKVIESEVYYQRPSTPCEIPKSVIRIAKAVQVPLGVEQLPADCVAPPLTSNTVITPPRENVYLTGKTVGEALDELVAVDPRYRWTASDGVIVMRPASAWIEKDHFLNRLFDAFRGVDQHMYGALHLWRNAMRGEERDPVSAAGAPRTDSGRRLFSVTLSGPATAEMVLDEIVRTHGRLYWEVRYCRPSAEARYAEVWLWTLDDPRDGLGVPLKERFMTPDGKMVDACAGTH